MLSDLSDAPLSQLPTPTPEATEYLDYLDMLLGDADDAGFAWAADTLSGIRQTITLRGRVTDAQRHAVSNIVQGVASAKDAKARRGRSRLDEGFRGAPR